MIKERIITFVILAIALTSMTGIQEAHTAVPRSRIDSFIGKYSKSYIPVRETYYSRGNDFILDSRVENLWDTAITLKRKTKLRNRYHQTVFPRLFLGFYHYRTDSLCSAALDSLLNCFGTDCGKLKWGDSGIHIKTIPTYYLVNRREIIVCRILCEHTDDFWIKFKDDLLTTFGNEDSRIIEAGCGGPVNFVKS